MGGLWIPIVLVGLGIAILAARLVTARRKSGYEAICEYWIYSTAEKLPDQKAIMTRLITENPYLRDGGPCITTREGLVMSDVRLHMGLALRTKNPHVFRPDLFEQAAVPSAEVLERLPETTSMIKLRYASVVVLKDLRHLQFMPHLADAVCHLVDGLVVYDRMAEELMTSSELTSRLEANGDAERPDFHVRVIWRHEEEGLGFAETRGLRKVGRRELRTDPTEADQQVLITDLLRNMSHAIFASPETDGPYEYEAYGDKFLMEPRDDDPFAQVAVRRQRQPG
ncbi:MAG: hypothetical protein IH944_11530 [Armatimonadetes bacterium]|nr:hypothetical protein [Armatimonadota bacterium]